MNPLLIIRLWRPGCSQLTYRHVMSTLDWQWSETLQNLLWPRITSDAGRTKCCSVSSCCKSEVPIITGK